LCTDDEWCDLDLCEAWWVDDFGCTGFDVAAQTGEAVKAATGRTRPSRANKCLREGVTRLTPVWRRCWERLAGWSKKLA